MGDDDSYVAPNSGGTQYAINIVEEGFRFGVHKGDSFHAMSKLANLQLVKC